MNCPDNERLPPQIGPLMPHCLHKADKLTLVGHHLKMTGSEWLAEEGNQRTILVQHCPKA